LGQEKKKWREFAIAEINKKIKRAVRGSKNKIKRKVGGSKKKINRNAHVAEKRRKIIPLKWRVKRTIKLTFVKASMNDMAETIVED
jgi:hypothetical protein